MSKPPLPSVTSYLDYREFLRDWFAARKAKDPRFSHTVFARKAGLASRTHAWNAAAGLTNLGGSAVEQFAKGLGLSAKEREYFGLLVAYNQTTDPAERDARGREVRRWQGERIRRDVPRSSLEGLLARWPRFLVYCLTGMRGFRADPAWIARKLSPRVSRTDAEDALSFLRSSGMIRTKGTRLLGSRAGHAQISQAEDNAPRTRRIVSALHRDAARLLKRSPEGFLSVHAILTDDEAREVVRAVRETLLAVIPLRERDRVKGRLYTFLWDGYPLSAP